jgi:hypothetical protein
LKETVERGGKKKFAQGESHKRQEGNYRFRVERIGAIVALLHGFSSRVTRRNQKACSSAPTRVSRLDHILGRERCWSPVRYDRKTRVGAFSLLLDWIVADAGMRQFCHFLLVDDLADKIAL